MENAQTKIAEHVAATILNMCRKAQEGSGLAEALAQDCTETFGDATPVEAAREGSAEFFRLYRKICAQGSDFVFKEELETRIEEANLPLDEQYKLLSALRNAEQQMNLAAAGQSLEAEQADFIKESLQAELDAEQKVTEPTQQDVADLKEELIECFSGSALACGAPGQPLPETAEAKEAAEALRAAKLNEEERGNLYAYAMVKALKTGGIGLPEETEKVLEKLEPAQLCKSVGALVAAGQARSEVLQQVMRHEISVEKATRLIHNIGMTIFFVVYLALVICLSIALGVLVGSTMLFISNAVGGGVLGLLLQTVIGMPLLGVSYIALCLSTIAAEQGAKWIMDRISPPLAKKLVHYSEKIRSCLNERILPKVNAKWSAFLQFASVKLQEMSRKLGTYIIEKGKKTGAKIGEIAAKAKFRNTPDSPGGRA